MGIIGQGVLRVNLRRRIRAVAATMRSQADSLRVKEHDSAGQRPAALARDLTVAATLFRYLIVTAIVALFVSITRGQVSKYARTKDFRYTEHYDRPIAPDNPTNAVKVLVRGAEGQFIENDQVRLTTARIEHYPMNGKGTNLIAITPICLFDPNAHTLASTDRVDIIARDGAIVVNGNAGFRFDTTNTTLHVSNRVRTTIQGSLLKSTRTLHP